MHNEKPNPSIHPLLIQDSRKQVGNKIYLKLLVWLKIEEYKKISILTDMHQKLFNFFFRIEKDF